MPVCWPPDVRAGPAVHTEAIDGRCAPSDGWGFRRGDELAPDRRVIRRLGDGGAHEAYVVETAGRGLAVAKLPRPSVADDIHRLVSLRDEARALRRLAAPAVPRHLETILTGEHPHLLMEYVPGPTLRTVLAGRGTLPAELVASLGRDLARGLDAVARAGWVHLDVKPSNVVVNAVPRLLDFELARPAASAARMPHPTGTWQYMAPEQRAAGRPGGARIGTPADVFALAVTLGEALVGRALGRSADPEPLPGALGAVLTAALAPAPDDRPGARELADALSACADDEPRRALAA